LKTQLKLLARKKVEIQSALKVKNEMMLVSAVRDLGAIGSDFGYPRLILIIDHLVRQIKPQMTAAQWREVEQYARQVLSLIDVILYEFS
jgi:hypothetical protein